MLPLILILFALISYGTERIFVVERETSSLTVIEEGKRVGKVLNLGNLNHATLKFRDGRGYVLSRDGVLTSFDPVSLKVLKKLRLANSSVGFTFCSEYIAVANYDPPSLAFADFNLKESKVIPLGSRAVGVKARGGLLFYLLMEENAIGVLDCNSLKEKAIVKEAGNLPFDALLTGNVYVAGFFGDRAIGILRTTDLHYKRIDLPAGRKGVPLKVPHLGFWGVVGGRAYIPAVGEKMLYVMDLSEGGVVGSINLKGNPVFAVVSPGGRWLAVNYSGAEEDYISLIDLSDPSRRRTKKAGRRITHLRFSRSGSTLYVSSYYENTVKALSVPDLRLLWEVGVSGPSGIFIYER